VKIQNPFRLGLFGGLGVLVAIVIGGAVVSLSTILTYVGAALFLALGIDPIVSLLERHRVRRALALVIVLVVILGVLAGLVFALIPVIVEQTQNISTTITDTVIPAINSGDLQNQIENALPFVDPVVLQNMFSQLQGWLSDNLGNIGNVLLQSGVAIANGAFGVVIVLILMIYFVSSLGSIKRGIYQLVPATKRPTFIDLSEQVSDAVGRYVMGQAALALCNGVLSAIWLSAIGVHNSLVLAFIAFLGSLIPLVGTLSATVINALLTLLFMGFDWHVVVVVIVYLVYMQVEAYVISPRIMSRAVQVPGALVVIAAVAGGTIGGVLGALVALPVAASVIIIVQKVIYPRQEQS
jgi:predicted PurR-regulated permease PerM